MNERDEELARSIDPDAWRQLHKDDLDWCKQFAELVRADERETIETLVESLFDDPDDAVLKFIVDAIRARGNT